MKNRFFTILPLLFILYGSSVCTQSLPVGTPLAEENWRRYQIKGEENSNVSFTIRPLQAQLFRANDSLFKANDSLSYYNRLLKSSFAKGKGVFVLLPLSVTQQFNSHHPYGWNDGSMISANGYQNQLSFGVFSKLGSLCIQLQPEIVFAQNAGFNTFPESHNDTIWKTYYNTVLNTIDNPERFGKSVFLKIFPGQSSIRWNYKKLSLGFSTENLWWGPGIRNALLMSNNAPGFPHLTVNTSTPVLTPIGSFEGQVLSGLLKKSGILPFDTSRTFNGQPLFLTKPGGRRYMNGLVLTWQPKWTNGLYLGFSRAFYMYTTDVKGSFGSYFPVITQIFKGSGNRADAEDALKRDQLLSFFFRLVFPKERAEIYGEFGRNDHSVNLRDAFLEPEHSRAYTVGLRKLFPATKNCDVEFTAEVTNLQIPSTLQVREEGSWYSHYQVRDGYTNQGQIIGAGIGSGGNCQTLGISILKKISRTRLQLERVIHNNDFYYAAFSPARDFGSHWVDLSIGLNNYWQHKHFLYQAELSWIKSLNYEWVKNNDVHNLHSRLAVIYLF